MFWPFTVWISSSSDREKLLKFEAEGRESAKFLRSLEHFFLTVGQSNFGNKIPFITFCTPKFIHPLVLCCRMEKQASLNIVLATSQLFIFINFTDNWFFYWLLNNWTIKDMIRRVILKIIYANEPHLWNYVAGSVPNRVLKT